MKKTILLLLVAALVASAFVGCKKEEEKVTLNLMGYGDNSNDEGVIWNNQITTFAEMNPGVEIVSELLYDEAYHAKVPARMAAQDFPHLAYTGADARWGAPWKEADQHIDNRPYIDADFYDMSLIPEMGPNGERYYLPIGISNQTSVLFANEVLINELGMAIPETYDDLKAMVPVAQEAGIDVIATAGAAGWVWGSCIMSTFVGRTAGEAEWVEGAVNGANSFEDDSMVQALEYLEMMVADGILDPKYVQVDYGTAPSIFSNGEALFLADGQWRAGAVENMDVRSTMKLMAWPVMPNDRGSMKGSVPAAWTVGYGVMKQAVDDGVDGIAADFLAYINNLEWSTQRLTSGAIVAPVIKGYELPSNVPVETAQKIDLAANAPFSQVIDAYLAGPPNNALNEGMQKIVSGTATAAEIAAEVESLAR